MFCKLNNLLQLQYNGMLNRLYKDFVSKEAYELNGDVLTALGRPYSVTLSLEDGNTGKDKEFEAWEGIDSAGTGEIREESLQAEVLKYILMQLRLFHDIKPVADDHMRSVLRGKLDEQLKFYDIATSDDGVAAFTLKGDPVDAETVIKTVEDESVIGRIMDGVDMDYARRLVGLMRYEEALEIFLPLIDRTEEGSMFNTELNFIIGEIYYHMDKSEESLKYYRKCNLKYIKDVRDYHLRVGHCLLDDKAGLRSNLIKMYYRCMLNPTYKKSVSDKYDRLVEQVEPIYADHEAKCEEVGTTYCL